MIDGRVVVSQPGPPLFINWTINGDLVYKKNHGRPGRWDPEFEPDVSRSGWAFQADGGSPKESAMQTVYEALSTSDARCM